MGKTVTKVQEVNGLGSFRCGRGVEAGAGGIRPTGEKVLWKRSERQDGAGMFVGKWQEGGRDQESDPVGTTRFAAPLTRLDSRQLRRRLRQHSG